MANPTEIEPESRIEFLLLKDVTFQTSRELSITILGFLALFLIVTELEEPAAIPLEPGRTLRVNRFATLGFPAHARFTSPAISAVQDGNTTNPTGAITEMDPPGGIGLRGMKLRVKFVLVLPAD
jgi:hypothetical protein